ncbi:neprilysin-1-like [Drosophila eugracilis]|uniref:neprilysin-1-like n=1 Tax=Drosophila eugracilis TaxID=29029 RepID=UPI001BD95929|nr:neprilysin-1-like [Drosophila eugracilis]
MLWLFFILVILMGCEARSLVESKDKPTNNSTADYLRLYANQMKSYMNLSVAPCEDFYEYACGNYRVAKSDRYSSNRRSNFGDVIYTLSEVVEQLVGRTDLAETLNVSSELNVAQRFFNACLEAELYPFNAADPAYLSLIRSIGGFPAVDGASWDATNFSWVNMSSHLTNYGANGLIREEILPVYPFSPRTKLPELGFDHIVQEANIASNTSRAYRLNEERMRGYLRSFNLTDDKITEVIDGVFAFWRDALEVPGECEMYSYYPAESQFNQSTNYYDISWNGLHADENMFCDFYYVELDKVCNRHPEAVANYLAMQMLYKLDPKLKAPKEQKDYCSITLLTSMTVLFNKLYMEYHFTEEKRLEVFEIVQELRKSIRKSLENAEWLDTATRDEALLKESAIEPHIGSLKDNARLDRIIREINSLKIDNDSFASTNINLKRLTIDLERFSSRHFEELGNDTKPQMMLQGMKAMAAYYVLDNSINVMAGLLEPPMYHRSYPRALKFGTLGFIVGHELTHGFDTTSASYDGNGKLRSWWSEKSRQRFEERAECYMDQYSKYLIPEINRHINGKTTMDENIADNGGLGQALAAYRSHKEQLLQDSGEEQISEQMPGLDITPEQLFFLGFAQIFCSDSKEEHYWKDLTNEHTVDKYRILGTLSNNEDFFQAYNCSVGSGMRPEHKACILW